MSNYDDFCRYCVVNGRKFNRKPATICVGREKKAWICVPCKSTYDKRRYSFKSNRERIFIFTPRRYIDYIGEITPYGLERACEVLTEEINEREEMDSTIFSSVPLQDGMKDGHTIWIENIKRLRCEIIFFLGKTKKLSLESFERSFQVLYDDNFNLPHH